MASTTSSSRRSRSAQFLSTGLFIAALGFAAAAFWVWYSDDSPAGPEAPPRVESVDRIDLAQVLAVLKEQEGDWAYSRNPATASASQIETPGQVLELDGTLLLVFIFTGANADEKIAAREAASSQLDLEALELSTVSGNVLNADGEPLRKAEHSNVLTILVGGDDSLNSDVQAALDTLP